jgi:hypothetical protein
MRVREFLFQVPLERSDRVFREAAVKMHGAEGNTCKKKAFFSQEKKAPSAPKVRAIAAIVRVVCSLKP